MDIAASIFNRISEVLGNPYVVKEVSEFEYRYLRPVQIEGALRLFEEKQFIDCILVHPTQTTMLIRLFRMSRTQASAAKTAFRSLAVHVPVFYSNFTSWYTPNKLTSLSELIRQNNSWSSVHIAVQAGLIEVMTKEQMGALINNQNCSKQRSAMHLACDLSRLDMLEKCVLIGGDLGLQDDNEDTAVHYCVAKCSKPFVKFVCAHTKSGVLDIQNNQGEAALHIACKMNKPDYVRMLLDAGANPTVSSFVGQPLHYALKYEGHELAAELLKRDSRLVHKQCNLYRSLPIHWSRTAEDVTLLVKHGSKVAFQSNTGDMPLHIMVQKNRLDAAIGLILSHANVNVKGRHGNTPLHLAIKNDNVNLVKMLLLFGADFQAKNDFQETPGLLAVRNSKSNKEAVMNLMSSVGAINLGENEMSTVKEAFDTVDGKPQSSNGDVTPKAKILCLDGGGIRGLVLTQILIAIEEQTGKQARDLFDWICGTSTGGILALSLALGIKAVDCQSIYFRLKDKVFSGPRPYDSAPMEEFLKNVFGEKTTLSDIHDHCKVIITSVLADQRPAKLFLFRNYEPAHEFAPNQAKKEGILKKVDSVSIQDILACPMDTPLWQVARSSGAAPSYFRPMGSFVDGGIMSNNPTLDVLTEVLQHNKALKQMNRTEDIKQPGLVLSVGTGKAPQTKVKSVDILRPTNPMSLLTSAMAGLELTQVLIDAACECDGHVQKRAEVWCESIGVPYFRLNPQLKEDTAMNESNDEKLVDLMWTTKLYLHQNKHLIEEIAHLLLKS